jgi:hypothetical protein
MPTPKKPAGAIPSDPNLREIGILQKRVLTLEDDVDTLKRGIAALAKVIADLRTEKEAKRVGADRG